MREKAVLWVFFIFDSVERRLTNPTPFAVRDYPAVPNQGSKKSVVKRMNQHACTSGPDGQNNYTIVFASLLFWMRRVPFAFCTIFPSRIFDFDRAPSTGLTEMKLIRVYAIHNASFWKISVDWRIKTRRPTAYEGFA